MSWFSTSGFEYLTLTAYLVICYEISRFCQFPPYLKPPYPSSIAHNFWSIHPIRIKTTIWLSSTRRIKWYIWLFVMKSHGFANSHHTLSLSVSLKASNLFVFCLYPSQSQSFDSKCFLLFILFCNNADIFPCFCKTKSNHYHLVESSILVTSWRVRSNCCWYPYAPILSRCSWNATTWIWHMLRCLSAYLQPPAERWGKQWVRRKWFLHSPFCLILKKIWSKMCMKGRERFLVKWFWFKFCCCCSALQNWKTCNLQYHNIRLHTYFRKAVLYIITARWAHEIKVIKYSRHCDARAQKF